MMIIITMAASPAGANYCTPEINTSEIVADSGWRFPTEVCFQLYGQFSKNHVCFCGLDPGNLKFETVRTHKQHICF